MGKAPLRVRGVALAVVGATFLAAASARAAPCDSPHLGTCLSADTLWPHAGAGSFASVAGTETVPAGRFALGLVTSYVAKPITLRTPSPGPLLSPAQTAEFGFLNPWVDSTARHAVEGQVSPTLLVAYGVTSRLELDLALPVVAAQWGSGVSALSGGDGLSVAAMRDLRFGAAFALLTREATGPRPSGLGLTLRSGISMPTGSTRQFAGEGAVVWIPSLAADWRAGPARVGAEVGGRIRPTRELLGTRLGTQLTVAVGAMVDILHLRAGTLALGAEARALPTFVEQRTLVASASGPVSVPASGHLVPAEWLGSLRFQPQRLLDGDVSFQLGAGTALPLGAAQDLTTAALRVVLGVRYVPGEGLSATPAPSPASFPETPGASR